jgi:hypothetical protein
MLSEGCQFNVVRTNGGDEVLARAGNLLIGRAALRDGDEGPDKASGKTILVLACKR